VKKLILLFVLVVQLVTAGEILLLGSASKEGNYAKIAQSIKTIIEQNTKYRVNILYTKGSVDNIHKLRKKEIDFAIAQSDVTFFAYNGFSPFKSASKDLRLLIELYKEPIYLVTNKKDIHTIEQIKNMRVGIGQKGSGLRESAKVILKSSNLLTKIVDTQNAGLEAQKLLSNKKIDAFFTNKLTPFLKKQIEQKKLFLVPIDKRIIDKFRATFSFYHPYKIDKGLNTVASKALLLTTDRLDAKSANKITNLLYENYDKLYFPNNKEQTALKKEALNSSTAIPFHEGAKKYINAIKATKQFSSKKELYLKLATIATALLLLWYIASKYFADSAIFAKVPTIKDMFFYLYRGIAKYRYITIGAILLIVYLLCIILIKYFEHKWAIEHLVYSHFDRLSFFDNALWFFLFSTIGNDGGIFPQSSEGKLIASFVPLIGWGGVFGFATLLASDTIKKYLLEVKGMGKVDKKGHIVIIGWNENACTIIKSLQFEGLSKQHTIIILALEEHKEDIQNCLLSKQNASYILSTGQNKEDLKRANIANASTIILLRDNLHIDPDAHSILDILNIKSFISTTETKKLPNIIAQIADNQNRAIALEAGAKQIISLSGIESKILASSVLNPGLHRFIEEVFEYNTLNDIYTLKIEKNCRLIGKTFDEILLELRKFDVLLLSIDIATNRNQEETRQIQEEYNLPKTLITNPNLESEKSYKLQANDTIITIAHDEVAVLKVL